MKATKNKLQRSRIVPTVILMTVLMLLASLTAVSFLGSTVITSFYRDCAEVDSVMDNIAVMTEKQILYLKNTLYSYAELLQTAGGRTQREALARLSGLEQDSFSSLILIGEDGSIRTAGEETLSVETAAQALDNLREQPQKDAVFFGSCGQNRVFVAVPCELAGGKQGAVAGIVPDLLNIPSLTEELETPDSSLYLLDQEQNVILFAGAGTREFRYDRLKNELVFDNFPDSLNQISMLAEEPGDPEQIELIRILLDGNSSVWYEKQLSGGNGQSYTLLVEKRAVLSENSAVIIGSSAALAAFIILFSFLLMLILVISQGISNRRLRRTAYIDTVTGMHNWTWLQLEAGRLLRRKKRNGDYYMVSMDIRKFRVISDVDGEMQSEAVLRRTALVLKKQLGKRERFSRFSVDEFAILLICGGEQDAWQKVIRLDEALKQQELLRGIEFCYGIYSIRDYGMPVHRMYNYAGIARDCVKGSHENYIGVFDDSMRQSLVREKELESRMEEALQSGEFKVYIQPKYSADGARVGGAEALVRWISRDLGFLSPGEFIPLFEKNGFITKLDIFMLQSICALQAEWLKRGHELVPVSVNVSRIHLMNPQLAQSIIHLADVYGVPHESLELEVTESAFFEDKQALSSMVRQLQGAGFPVSMDDFGSGYSSLNSLKELPFDVVKLDGEFFHYGENRERSETVIRDTIALARDLKMKIVAEGIETKEQVDFLHEIGCDYIQGYYFAKPMPAREFAALMKYDEQKKAAEEFGI